MRHYLIFILSAFLSALPVFWVATGVLAQGPTYSTGAVLTKGSSLPATCNVGELYAKTSATVGLYICTATDTWTAASTGGGAASAPLTGTGATVTASTPLIDVSQTWNNSSVAFTGIKENITNTASRYDASGISLLLDLSVGGNGVFQVTRTGNLIIGQSWANMWGGAVGGGLELLIQGLSNGPADILLNGLNAPMYLSTYNFGSDAFFDITSGGVNSGSSYLQISATKHGMRAAQILGWAASTDAEAALDTGLRRNAAGIVEVNNGTACSTASNCRDLTLRHLIASGTAPSIGTCGTGTLATGSSDTSGRFTATGATACTITFGTTFGGNSADCTIANMTADRGNVSAASSTAFTVSNLTDGDVVAYHCVGR
jgi:hypothetical protein